SFSISHAKFALGGSEYRFTLSAVRGQPGGAHLTFTFVAPGTSALHVKCKGTVRACTATVPLPRGGLSNRQVHIELPGTSSKRPTVSVSPGSSRGSFSITHRRFALRGCEYRCTLNAARGQPIAAHLTLKLGGRVRAGRARAR